MWENDIVVYFNVTFSFFILDDLTKLTENPPV